MKTYGKTGTALLAAALLCAGGAVQAAEFTVNSQEDLTEEKGWAKYDNVGILAPTQGISGNNVIIDSGETSKDFISHISGAYSVDDAVSGNSVILERGWVYRLYGGYSKSDDASDNKATISGGTVEGVYGGWSSEGSAERNTVTISGGTVTGSMYGAGVYGGYSKTGDASGNTVTLSGGTVKGSVYGGKSENGVVTGNTVTLTGTANAEGANLYGSNKEVSTANSGNKLVVDNWRGTVGGLHNFDSIEFQNVKLSEEDTTTSSLEVNGEVQGVKSNAVKVTSLAAGDYAAGPDKTLTSTITWSNKINDTTADVSAVKGDQWFTADREEGGLYANQYNTEVKENGNHKVVLESSMTASVLTGKFIDENGEAHYNSAYTPDENGTGQTLVIDNGFTTNVDTVAGAYAAGSQDAAGGRMYITGTPAEGFTKTVYAGYSENGAVKDNDVYLDNNMQAGGLHLLGRNEGSTGGSGNTLHVTGTGNTLGSIGQFNTLAFDDVTLYEAGEEGTAALSADTADLSSTELHVASLASGYTYQVGDHVTLVGTENGLTMDDGTQVTHSQDVLAGVTQDITLDTVQTTDSIGLRVSAVSLDPQVVTIAENRTAAAAFLNQGADIAADSLDLLGTDYKYGLRTFGAVYGSRSTYDAAGDLKINGWSEIVGLGNVHRKGDGDLSWGIFYENGTGNYRTWNEFNNEMFRGDGSLLYNGGGAAVRYKQDDGWYYEASLRAGTLSASMDNAVKDGKGNSYGFDSDSTYWGAHAGVGKVIETERGEWNVYGKYFHTDIDGDSFNIAGDAFTFDSLTSDRLRIGARYTADKAKRWSLYYGLAWEYEFSGDSHMKAGQWDAPEQSLGGSTGIAEIGTVWQPDDSPWQANINLKGYAGEREGVSGMVQLAYTF